MGDLYSTCEEINFYLNNFNSYFELLVAFTFAYAGIKGFKDYINTISLKNFDTNGVEKRKNEIEEYKSYFTVAKVSPNKTSSKKSQESRLFFIKKLYEADEIIKNIKEIYSKADKVAQGEHFKPMFYLVGALYLFFIVLGGFSILIDHKAEYLTIFISTTVCYIYLLYLSIVLFLESSNISKVWFIKIAFETKWRSSYYILKLFPVVISLILIGSIITVKNYNIYEFLSFLDNKIQPYFGVCNKCITKVLITLLALGVSLIPYMLYYYREHLYLKKYVGRLDVSTQKLEDIVETIKNVKNFKEDL